MQNEEPGGGKVNLFTVAAGIAGDYGNVLVARANDHVLRLSVMSRDFHWHAHAESDEIFIVLDGELCIDLEGGTEILRAGDCYVVPRGLRHRTRAVGRSVNLTVEHESTSPAGTTGE